MLFRTVYGPELEALYLFVAQAEAPLSRPAIHAAFIARLAQGEPVSTQSVDDALAFLESARLIEETRAGYRALIDQPGQPFRALVLQQLRRLEVGTVEPLHPLDPLYLLLLTELFIKPDQLFLADLHVAANNLRQVAAAGGLSREKLQAWKRVMEFLGTGRRVASGFQCAYSPDLLLDILDGWPAGNDSLQSFFEDYLDPLLPCYTGRGDLALAVQEPLLYLGQAGAIALTSRQDSPSKPYFGERKLRYIARLEVADAVR